MGSGVVGLVGLGSGEEGLSMAKSQRGQPLTWPEGSYCFFEVEFTAKPKDIL